MPQSLSVKGFEAAIVTFRWLSCHTPKVPSAAESARQDRAGQDSDENGPFDLAPLLAQISSNRTGSCGVAFQSVDACQWD